MLNKLRGILRYNFANNFRGRDHLLIHHLLLHLEWSKVTYRAIGNVYHSWTIRWNNSHLIIEPCSSGYGRRLTFRRLWVWIPVPYTGWTWHFFTLIICKKNCIVCLKRPKLNKKEAGIGPFFRKNSRLIQEMLVSISLPTLQFPTKLVFIWSHHFRYGHFICTFKHSYSNRSNKSYTNINL